MKGNSLVRKIDPLGRVVIPKGLRRKMNIDCGDTIEIYLEDTEIVLKQYKPLRKCIVTDEVSEKNMLLADGKITLSSEGAKALLLELRQHFKKENE